ncbi:MAG: hypothetical protein QOJ64_3258 [Acidobacteriota bacterium]|nr:hypothetical protein [Acidobacteriota bacterium]
MANPEHLQILKQGVEAWNRWRKGHLQIKPDLSEVVLPEAQLSRINFRRVNLLGSDLNRSNLVQALISQADLREAVLIEADLKGAKLQKARLQKAILTDATLIMADLTGSNLHSANLRNANLSASTLTDANLYNARVSSANLSGALLSSADLTNAEAGRTNFSDIDLSSVKGLETVSHVGPSSLGIDTLYKSNGRIPEAFLRGCGLSDWQIENVRLFKRELSNEEITDVLYRVHDLRAHQAIQINPLFISYSHSDSPFVDMMEEYLNERGIRFWRDTHHATAGRLERQIERAIRLNPTVLLVLSSHSVESDWVEHEARLARKLELETKRDTLCPIALDDSWKGCAWPDRLREQIMEYNILDFSDWKDEARFRGMSDRLIEGLDLFYQ